MFLKIKNNITLSGFLILEVVIAIMIGGIVFSGSALFLTHVYKQIQNHSHFITKVSEAQNQFELALFFSLETNPSLVYEPFSFHVVKISYDLPNNKKMELLVRR